MTKSAPYTGMNTINATFWTVRLSKSVLPGKYACVHSMKVKEDQPDRQCPISHLAVSLQLSYVDLDEVSWSRRKTSYKTVHTRVQQFLKLCGEEREKAIKFVFYLSLFATKKTVTGTSFGASSRRGFDNPDFEDA